MTGLWGRLMPFLPNHTVYPPSSFAVSSISVMANYSHKFAASLLHFPLSQSPQPFCSYFEWEADQQWEIPQRMQSAWATTPLMSFLCNIRLPTSRCTLVVDCPQWAQAVQSVLLYGYIFQFKVHVLCIQSWNICTWDLEQDLENLIEYPLNL